MTEEKLLLKLRGYEKDCALAKVQVEMIRHELWTLCEAKYANQPDKLFDKWVEFGPKKEHYWIVHIKAPSTGKDLSTWDGPLSPERHVTYELDTILESINYYLETADEDELPSRQQFGS